MRIWMWKYKFFCSDENCLFSRVESDFSIFSCCFRGFSSIFRVSSVIFKFQRLNQREWSFKLLFSDYQPFFRLCYSVQLVNYPRLCAVTRVQSWLDLSLNYTAVRQCRASNVNSFIQQSVKRATVWVSRVWWCVYVCVREIWAKSERLNFKKESDRPREWTESRIKNGIEKKRIDKKESKKKRNRWKNPHKQIQYRKTRTVLIFRKG